MTRSIPAVLTRAAFVDQTGRLTREGALFLDALRSAVGGDAATVTPNDPAGSLLPVAAFAAATDPLSPVTTHTEGADALSPISPLSGVGAPPSLTPGCI